MTHELVLQLDDEHALSEKNVKLWIKHNADHLKAIKHYEKSKESKERREFFNVKNYLDNLRTYLRTGVYLDNRWGIKGDKKMLNVCYAKAYDENGVVKRNKNTWYDDIGWYETEGVENDPVLN